MESPKTRGASPRDRRAILSFMAAACSLSVALFGCDKKPGESGAKTKIGFIVKQPEEPWFQLEWKFGDEAARQHGFELVKIGASDGEKTLAAIDSLGAGGAKGFVICTPDVRLGPAIVAAARRNGLKFMSVDDQFVGADGKFMTDVPHLGISARAIGEMVGKALSEEMRNRHWTPENTALCAVTFDELDTARERTEGAISALTGAGFPQARIFKTAEKSTDVPGGLDAANVLLTQQPGVTHWLVCGLNDNSVMGAVRAMEGRGFGADAVIAVGINGTDCIAELEKPTPTGFFGSVLLTPKRHGFETVEMVYAWVHDGKEPPKDTRTTGVLITRANFARVLKEQGIRDK